MQKIVIIWVDAFSDRYLTPELAPFLCEFSKTCYAGRISPLFAYMGIEYSFEYGVPLSELGVWNDHVYAASAGVGGARDSLFRGTVRLIDRVSSSDEWNKALRYGFFKVSGFKYGVPHLIPSQYLRSFPVPVLSFERENLFDLMEKNNVHLLKKEPKLNRSEAGLIKNVPKLLNSYDVILFKLNSLDRLGHKYGPSSEAVAERIKFLDGLLSELASSLPDDAVLIVMSDHGMVPVKSTFDVMSYLKQRGFTLGKEYLGYVGATYTSFWFKDDAARNAIIEALNTADRGRFLSQTDKASLGIDNPDKKFGQEIYVVNEYTVMFPEFYHTRKPPKGMHGYATNNHDKPIFLMKASDFAVSEKSSVEFIDLMPTLLTLLGLPVPSGVTGKSFVSKT